MRAHSEYTVAIICALQTEFLAAQVLFDEEYDIPEYQRALQDNNTYAYGRIAKHNVVIAALSGSCSRISSTAHAARALVQSFPNIRIGLLVGIAGGVPRVGYNAELEQDIRLGDVVIGTRVVQYDYAKAIKETPFEIVGYCNPPPKSILAAVSMLRAQFERMGNTIDEDVAIMVAKNNEVQKMYKRPDPTTDCLFESSYIHKHRNQNCFECCNTADHTIQRKPRYKHQGKVMLHYGRIASANQFMKNASIRDKFAREHGVLCFEMDATGIMNYFPCLVIRGICDYADSHKSKTWQGYAAAIAATVAKQVLLRWCSEEHTAESRLGEFEQARELQSSFEVVQSDIPRCPRSFSRADIERWLAAPNPEIDFRSALNQREPGTAQWVLNSEAFLRWKNGDTRHLWVHGKAGSGKSVLAASIIENIRSYCAGNSEIGCSIFYFSFSDRSKQSHTDCLHSMVQQLYAHRSFPLSLEQLFATSKDRREGCLDMEKDLQNILCDEVKSYKQFFLILDGLDECPETGSNYTRQREQLLRWLHVISVTLPMLQILTTSRPWPDIEAGLAEIGFQSQSMITDSLTIDIGKYVINQLNQDRRLRKLSMDLKTHIQEVLVSKADSMFLWVTLQMKDLRRLQSTQPSRLEKVLRTLPSNLVETFDRMIKHFPKTEHDALVLLKWLTYSHRPLTVLELSEARIIHWHTEGGDVASHDRGNVEDVLEIFSGLNLVTKSEGKPRLEFKFNVKHKDIDFSDEQTLADRGNSLQVVHFVHTSVKQFFQSWQAPEEWPQSIGFQAQKEQQILAHKCVLYLMHYADTKSITKTSQDFKDFPLLEYAATSWYIHCQETDDVDKEVQFLLSGAFLDSLLVHDPDRPWRRPFETRMEYEKEHTNLPLYYASLLGLSVVVGKLIRAGVDVNGQGGIHDNALQAAIDRGHVATAKLLVEAGADVNAQDELYGHTPLHFAARSGHNATVELLIEAGADVNAQDELYGHTPLHFAARSGHNATIKLLIEAGADVNAQDALHGHTPLHLAALQGYYSIVKLLIEAGTDIDAPYTILGEKPRKVIADTMHDLGLLYYGQSKLMKAEKMYLRTLHSYEQSLGRTHISTLMVVNNLGILYKNEGKHEQAMEMYIRALQGYAGRPDYKMSMLKTVNNLGALYSEQGKLELAGEMYMQAIEGYSETLGYKNPLTLDAVTNLGGLYLSQGKLDAAEQLFVQALCGFESALGAKHVATLGAANNLGLLYEKQGRLDEAEQMLLQALDGKKEQLGSLHLSTLSTISNLAVLYSAQNRLAKAEELLLGVLHGYEEAVGVELVKTYIPALSAAWALGNLYSKDRPSHARNAYTKALHGYEVVQGKSSKACLILNNQLDLLGNSDPISKQPNTIKPEENADI